MSTSRVPTSTSCCSRSCSMRKKNTGRLPRHKSYLEASRRNLSKNITRETNGAKSSYTGKEVEEHKIHVWDTFCAGSMDTGEDTRMPETLTEGFPAVLRLIVQSRRGTGEAHGRAETQTRYVELNHRRTTVSEYSIITDGKTDKTMCAPDRM